MQNIDFFVWLPSIKIPENTVIAIARDDDTTFGILHSRFHEAWSLRLGTWLGVGERSALHPNHHLRDLPVSRGLDAKYPGHRLCRRSPRDPHRNSGKKTRQFSPQCWLNPPDLIRIEPEVAPGYPDRILPKDADAAKKLKERTLTNLYHQRPQWLADAHEALDCAVAAAYGWPDEISTEEALEKLLALNLARQTRQENRS